MRRRQLLTAIAGATGGLTGCSALGPGGGGGAYEKLTPVSVDDSLVPTATHMSQTEVPSGSPRERIPTNRSGVVEPTGQRIALSRTDMSLDTMIRFLAGVHTDQQSDRPPVVRGLLRNQDLLDREFYLENYAPFGEPIATLQGNSGTDAIVFAPTHNDELATAVPAVSKDDSTDLWALEDPTPASWYPGSTTLPERNGVIVEWHVVPAPDGEVLSGGTYEFANRGGTLKLGVWSRDDPGPTRSSAFAGATPPTVPNAGSTHWFHDATSSTRVWVEPHPERLTIPGELTVTLHNHSGAGVTEDLRIPTLYKFLDGSWYEIAEFRDTTYARPTEHDDSGGDRWAFSKSWTVEVAATGPTTLDVIEDTPSSIEFLGGGNYAVGFHSIEHDVAIAALVGLEGPPITVEPTTGVSKRESDGSTVVLDAGSDGYRTIVVERADGAREKLLPEQVMQPSLTGLRNTLPFFESNVDRVELPETSARVFPQLQSLTGSRRFEFEGEAYKAIRG